MSENFRIAGVRNVTVGPGTVSSQPVAGSAGHPPSQHDLVLEYSGSLGYDKVLSAIILIRQRGLNYPGWRRRLERT